MFVVDVILNFMLVWLLSDFKLVFVEISLVFGFFFERECVFMVWEWFWRIEFIRMWFFLWSGCFFLFGKF